MSLSVDIRKSYPNFELDVSFEAGSETLGLLGASGCGKSLTLRCIAGLEKPDEGRIVVAGTTFFDSKQGINLTAQQRKTALLFQSYMLFPNLTVAQNIAAGIPPSTPKATVHAIIKEQLERFDLAGFGKRYPIRLSGGQQQRVALARMLAAHPAILMLDEPFSALDAHLKSSLEQGLLDLFDSFEGSIVYVSHDIDEAFRFCDRIAVIDQGQLAEVATCAQMLDHPTTYATLRVSGVKNVSPVRRLSAHEVEALDWGITLTTEQEVPSDVAFAGIRAAFIEPADGADARPNCFDCTVLRTVDSRFERSVFLRPAPLAAQPLHWRFSNAGAPSPSVEKSVRNPSTGASQRDEARTRIHIPPSRIYLVSG
ncbi:MAG: ATP-binding cassette domain-containing protein [Coriobacteriales bacterium]|nr:ATP-binding cassette domain-containing protein [Coriobacteriales bacterium]